MEDQETSPATQHSDKQEKVISVNAPEEPFDPNLPRLGRRESEPHSQEVTYLHDVLESNFPDSRVMWDLHHYFAVKGVIYDIRFDISFFPGFNLPVQIPSYRAADYGNRIPTLTINILSKSTFRSDLSETLEACNRIKIPIYIVFCSHPINSDVYYPPFLRAYMLQESGKYTFVESRQIAIREGDPLSKLDTSALLDLQPYVTFKIGIMEKVAKYIRNESLYRVILWNPNTQQFFLSKLDIEKLRADQEKQRADQEKQRADQEKQRADQEKQRADQLEQKIKDLTTKSK